MKSHFFAKVIGLAVAAAVSFGIRSACSHTDANRRLDALADRACDCKTPACAEGVVNEVVQYINSHPAARGNEQAAKRAGERLGKCAVEAGMNPHTFIDKISQINN